MGTIKDSDGISISIRDADITFVEGTHDGIRLTSKQNTKFAFEFEGLIADKFYVLKGEDNLTGKKFIEIHLRRGIGINLEEIRLFRLTHYNL